MVAGRRVANAAMCAETLGHGVARSTRMVAGRGEQLPLRRHADTLLGQFTLAEIAHGLTAIDALDPSRRLEHPRRSGYLRSARSPAVGDVEDTMFRDDVVGGATRGCDIPIDVNPPTFGSESSPEQPAPRGSR